MKHFLSIEFHNQGESMPYKIGDSIAFISFKGSLKIGTIIMIKWMNEENLVPFEFLVDCKGKELKALPEYTLKIGSKVLNLTSIVSELNNGFPLGT